jgi:endonuclease/exonuclease/phosphatase family metal-dependent hydrolase
MIRAATWNMAGAALEYLGVGLEGITRKVIADGIDFCSLQEVNQDARPVEDNPLSSANFPRYMEAELFKAGRIGGDGRAMGEAFFTAANIEDAKMEGWPPRTYGNCILSTRRLLRHKLSFQLDGPDVPPDTPEWGRDIRILQLAQVRSEGPELWVANTHLSATANATVVEYQARNIVFLIAKVVPADASVILSGDFNTTLDGAALGSLCDAFDCQTEHVGPTFPLNRADPDVVPDRGIDHIFTRHMRVDAVRVEWLRDLSDHAVVIADMETVRPGRVFDMA